MHKRLVELVVVHQLIESVVTVRALELLNRLRFDWLRTRLSCSISL
jgi:hypothetical protein